MAKLYKFDGPRSPQTDYTDTIVLERDESGVATRAISVGEVGEIPDDQAEQLGATLKLKQVEKSNDHVYGLGFEELGNTGSPADEVAADTVDSQRGRKGPVLGPGAQ